MAKVNDLLNSRFNKSSKSLSKMNQLADLSSSGRLSSFSGVFRVTPLNEHEEETLRTLLSSYTKQEDQNIDRDLKTLCGITSEIKAINNQAAILHGERIQHAQQILKPYKDGAFSAWMIQTYGNRQTPYNFLQYYQLHLQVSHDLKEKMDIMPRQALYTLASRNCQLSDKESMIKNYQGETKQQLLEKIRKQFPLSIRDKRAQDPIESIILKLHQIEKQLADHSNLTLSQRNRMREALSNIQNQL